MKLVSKFFIGLLFVSSLSGCFAEDYDVGVPTAHLNFGHSSVQLTEAAISWKTASEDVQKKVDDKRCAMKVLIVYTYPNHASLNYAFLQKVIKGSEENVNIGEIQVLDLYEEGFNPLLVFNEQKRRRDMHKDPVTEKYRQQLLWADKLVFIYPIWWGRPPAMLLGYIDQMFASNFAYRDKKGLLPEGLLKGKSVVCVSTMKGPAHYPLFWLNNAHKILMKRALFNFVGIKKVKFFEFGNMEKADGNQEKKLEKVYQYFRKVAL